MKTTRICLVRWRIRSVKNLFFKYCLVYKSTVYVSTYCINVMTIGTGGWRGGEFCSREFPRTWKHYKLAWNSFTLVRIFKLCWSTQPYLTRQQSMKCKKGLDMHDCLAFLKYPEVCWNRPVPNCFLSIQNGFRCEENSVMSFEDIKKSTKLKKKEDK